MTRDTCGTTAASLMRRVCMRLGCRSFDGGSRRLSAVLKTMPVSWSITWPIIWLSRPREVSHRERLLLHFIAQCTMELLNLCEVPFEGCDGIGHFKVCDGQLVASTLIAGECRLR